MYAWSAEHRSRPLGTCVQVVNLTNGRHVVVRINDRGPYVSGRAIDLSSQAARELQTVDAGLAPVKVIHVTPEKCVSPSEGNAFAQRHRRVGAAYSSER